MNKTTPLTAVALFGLFMTAVGAYTTGESLVLWLLPGLSLLLLAAAFTIRALSEYRDVFGAIGAAWTAVMLISWLALTVYLAAGLVRWFDGMSGGPF